MICHNVHDFRFIHACTIHAWVYVHVRMYIHVRTCMMHTHTHTHTHAPHADDHVYVTPHSLSVCREEVGLRGLQSCVLHHRLHLGIDLVQVLWWVDVGDISSIEDVVDVFQEALALDLCVSGGRRERETGEREG